MAYTASPLTPACEKRLTDCTHVCVGVSPFNGYFTAGRIAELVAWALEAYPDSHFFVPDEAPAYTFMALGYEEKKARHKARRQGQYVVNKIKTGMELAGIEPDETRILTAARLRENPRYVELAAHVRERFEDDPMFREETMTTSEWVLAGYLPAGQAPTQEQKLLAVQYFLDELPLFLDTPGIVGVPTSTFVYHQRVPFLEKLYTGGIGLEVSTGQSFTVLTKAEEPELALVG